MRECGRCWKLPRAKGEKDRLNDWHKKKLNSWITADCQWWGEPEHFKNIKKRGRNIFCLCVLEKPLWKISGIHTWLKKICATFRGEDIQPARSLANRVLVFKPSWSNHRAYHADPKQLRTVSGHYCKCRSTQHTLTCTRTRWQATLFSGADSWMRTDGWVGVQWRGDRWYAIGQELTVSKQDW